MISAAVVSISRQLPDVSMNGRAPAAHALDWVGMRNIRMPVRLDDALMTTAAPGSFDALVSLPGAGVKGIHMSRLYTLLFTATQNALAPADLCNLLMGAVASHHECGTDAANLVLRTELVRPSSALVTEGLKGWSSHRVEVNASIWQNTPEIWLTVDITYSSTCPCSASLARQLMEESFRDDHKGRTEISVSDAASWIAKHGTLATPHSQRSIARIKVSVSPYEQWNLASLIEDAECALSTPSQGPVKRADEQEFALRNGQNVMFVEDAARLLLSTFSQKHPAGSIEVTHLESLHPHDAFAFVRWGAAA